jgi:hypothetical protein
MTPSKLNVLAYYYPKRCADDAHLMTNGCDYDPYQRTIALWDYPLGELVRVSYKNRSVVCEVTDSPTEPDFECQMSWAAYRCLVDASVKSIRVEIEKYEPKS